MSLCLLKIVGVGHGTGKRHGGINPVTVDHEFKRGMDGMGKLSFDGTRVSIDTERLIQLGVRTLVGVGCQKEVARSVAEHLVQSDLCGVESHGCMRLLQYVEQFESGYLNPVAIAVRTKGPRNAWSVDGGGGIGIPVMEMAIRTGCEEAQLQGISVTAIRNVGHTGRVGAFVEMGAVEGCLSILIGGGGRENWRQVAPYGGRKALLPTNPYAIGVPGGEKGPVVLDFATGKIAGGWIYAARSAGARLPEGVLLDPEGQPTTDPEDYFAGGAILPAGGAKGYALALVAELIGEAMLGPVATEMNWLLLCLDTTLYAEPGALQQKAEEILAEIRSCPPLEGIDQVAVPGEREREIRHRAEAIHLPEPTWQALQTLESRFLAMPPA